ncbi:hypothetical protein [Nocardioides ferulae]|uniref:hypothetical protein n=1 Tax=Nocardioides ferulae TaxID=2340821 RepID=UPI000EAF58E2|nr:hypothetical protein [Nocardioides ferulae]
MKKILAGTFATLMMGSGMVALTSAPATAGPYTGTVETSTSIDAPAKVRKGAKARICVTVTAVDSDTRPKGRITVRAMHGTKGLQSLKTKDYRGSTTCLRTHRLKKIGKYTVRVHFDRKAGSIWKDSNQRVDMKVTRRR